VPETFVYLCIEVSVEDVALLYSVAQRKGKDVRTYMRDVLREDIARTLTQQIPVSSPGQGRGER